MSAPRPAVSARARSIERSAPLFAALGDETRLRVVTRLSTGEPQSIVRLTSGSDVSRQAITKHLQVLAAAGLVRSVRRGRERLWELEPRRIDEARRALQQISESWDEALGRLKAFVER
jgi:DNA-binding transcriptional ArsR family regulator